MAAPSSPVPTELDVIELLKPESIPARLKCALCSKLAVDAYRLPCCSQSVCSNCHPSLGTACPVCEHTPLSLSDVLPSRALRNTIKIFLKTKMSEQKAALAKDAKLIPQRGLNVPSLSGLDTEPQQLLKPNEDANSSSPTQKDIQNGLLVQNQPVTKDFGQTPSNNISHNQATPKNDLESMSLEASKDIPRESIEEVLPEHRVNSDTSDGTSNTVHADGATGNISLDGANESVGDQPAQMNAGQLEGSTIPLMQQSLSNGAMPGQGIPGASFMNQGWNGMGNLNPMTQMQGGMMAGGFGAFPNMMGMPGMGINPMGMSAGMYGGFGGPSMGMNGIGALGGMNAGMGMGFNAMNSGFNGWNGNSAWNSGQNNFNPNTFGMNANRMGDFGSNSGFNSASGRHDQMHQPQFAQYNLQGQFQHRQGQHQQSRGRNPGFGRGNNGFPGRNADIQPFPQQIPSQTNPAKNNLRESSSQQQTPAPANENKIAESAAEGSNIENKDAETKPDEVSKELGGADSTAGTLKPPGTPEPAGNEHDRTTEKPELPLQMDVVVEDSDKIQVLRVPETVVLTPDTDAPLNVLPNGIIPPSGPAALMNQGTSFDVADRGRGGFRGGFGRGNGVGIGFHGRGHGSWSTLGGASSGLNANKHTMNSSLVSIPSEPRGVGVAGAPTAPKALREGLPNVGLRGRLSYQLSTRVSASTNSVEKAKSPSPKYRRSRSRSRSPARRETGDLQHNERPEVDNESGREQKRGDRRRHSRRYEDEEYERDRERNRERDQERSRSRSRGSPSRIEASPRSKRSSHRRHRSRERYHRRHRSRSRSRSRSHSRTRRPRSRSRSPARPSSRADKYDRHEKSGAAKYDKTRERRGSQRQEASRAPEVNSHDREREARNRERLLKEQQRREENSRDIGSSRRDGRERKRAREVDEGSERRSKRGGVRHTYEETSEERALRIEQEREAPRWQ